MTRKLARAAAATLLIATLAACDNDREAQPATHDDVSVVDKDSPDCDADDKVKREVPDCGFYSASTPLARSSGGAG